jgi:arylsulfatase A-like enzyme
MKEEDPALALAPRAPGAWLRLVPWAITVACCGLVFALVSCSSGNDVIEDVGLPTRPSIIFLTIDTLRADHVGGTGYPRETTPYLDRLASEAAYFSHCYSQCSWTLPSMLSMFSSLPPPVFGIKEGIRVMPAHRRRLPAGLGYQDVLAEHFSDEHLMLPEVLSDHSYYSAGFSTNGHLSVEQGFAQGFDAFDQSSCMWGNAECVLGTARRWLDGYLAAGNGDPFFLWVHLFDPHFSRFGNPPEYDPPRGYESLFQGSGGEAGTLGIKEQTQRAYDRRVRYMDDRIADFCEGLRSQGILDEVLLVVAADHGEEFNEDTRWGHSRSVRNTLVHVPLIFRFPGAQWKGVTDLIVSNLDVAPTMLDFLGIPIPASMEGQSLLPALRGEPLGVRFVYGETRRFDLNLRFLIDPTIGRKLVLDLDAGRRQLFSTRDDRAEVRDLVLAEPDRTDSMEVLLREAIAGMEARATRSEVTRTLSDQEMETLRSLGYLK